MIKRSILLFSCTALMASNVYCLTKVDSPVDNKSTYHISNNVDLVTTTDMQYGPKKMTIKLVYPRLASSDDSNSENVTESVDDSVLKMNSFNEQVTRVINEEIARFKEQVANYADVQKTMDKSKLKNRLTIDYSSAVVNLDDQPILSIRFVAQGYVSGMKQPFRWYRSLNFDFGDGRELSLSDLFKQDSDYLATIAEYANQILGKKLRGYTPANSMSPSDNQFANWNINLNGIRITFDPDTIAPASYGSQTILIPYTKFKDLINPESAFGQCLKHRKHCMGEHLLTGGFIDEAANSNHSRLNPALC